MSITRLEHNSMKPVFPVSRCSITGPPVESFAVARAAHPRQVRQNRISPGILPSMLGDEAGAADVGQRDDAPGPRSPTGTPHARASQQRGCSITVDALEGWRMTYYPDLSNYEYSCQDFDAIPITSPPTVNVGWLDAVHAFPTGETPPGFAARLLEFCRRAEIHHMGLHSCPFGDGAVGGSEIRVFGTDRVWAAPVLIIHYVTKHHYQPPQDFVRDVLEAP